MEFPEGSDREWMFGILEVMSGVEYLEIRGGWIQMLRLWCGDRERKKLCPALRKLTVNGGESAGPDLAVFEDARHNVGLPLVTTRFLRDGGS